MNERISDSAQLLPPTKAMEILPDVVVAIILGAEVTHNYQDGDGVLVDFNEASWHLSRADYEAAACTATELEGELRLGRIASANQVLKIRLHAARKIKKELEVLGGYVGHSVAMLKDKGSSGWWRMILPARHMQKDGWRFDCTAAPVDYDNLLEYDTIFVQRIHDWESYYMLEKLKAVGKRIVYDIDDDLFNITPDNPAYNTITRDDQLAAARCMKLADVVTTTTEELQRRLMGVMEGVEPLVVPNAWDINDRWRPVGMGGSPDNVKRILWSGGASHGADWEECFTAVDEVMQERDDVRLVILGYLPPCIERVIDKSNFRGRIEFLGFRSPETYYETIHHVRADVALAPVRSTGFNAAKSSIKFLEYSSIGIPTVASDWLPYNAVIEDGKSGRLVKTTQEWKEAILQLLDDRHGRQMMVKEARKACYLFDVNKTSKTWTDILCVE